MAGDDYVNDKYIVFKAEEFQKWWGQGSVGGTEHEVPSPNALPDAVVIRLQDVFAGPGLSAYANCVQTALDLRTGEPSDVNDHREELEKLRDFFWSMAQDALNRDSKKIPD